MSTYYNTNRPSPQYSVGDLVLLSTTNLALPSVLTRKLAPKYIGPFKILQVINPTAYKLDLPAQFAKIHPVFHTSLLKAFHGVSREQRPPVFQDASTSEYEVEQLLAHRTVRNQTQYLIQWKGYPSWDNTWEPESNLTHCQDLLQEYRTRFMGT